MRITIGAMVVLSVTLVIYFCIKPASPDSATETVDIVRGDPLAVNYPLANVKLDNGVPFVFDISRPYSLQFGRGSGWHGLNTIKISENGEVVIHQRKRNSPGGGGWESCTTMISEPNLIELAKEISRLGLLAMNRSYNADVHDGTQWVFWLRQENEGKSIYFNNHFPQRAQDFAVFLDNLLIKCGLEKAKWTAIPAAKKRSHEKALWGSIR